MAEIRVELRDFTDNILGNLDITSSDDFPLSLNYQNFDIRDFNSRSGSFSKTFKVPATRNNNKLFNHIYKDGNIDSKNVLKDLPSTIYADHLPIMNGKLRVSQIYKNTDVLEYECLFLGDNMDWADKIKNADLDELRFSSTAYSSYGSISSSSWVFENPRTTYPSYVKNHDKLVYPLLTIGEGDNTTDSTLDSDFIPAVFVKNVWDKIFQAQGYTVSSTFCDSNFFKNLIMPLIFKKPTNITDVSFGKVFQSEDEELLHIDYDDHSLITDTRSIGNQTYQIASSTTPTEIDGLFYVMSADTLTDDAPAQSGLDTDDYGNAQLGHQHTSDGNVKNGLVVAAQSSGLFNMKATVGISVDKSSTTISGSVNYAQYRVRASIVKFTGLNDDTESAFETIATAITPIVTANFNTDDSTYEHTFNFQQENPVEAAEGDKFGIVIKFVHRKQYINTQSTGCSLKLNSIAENFLQIEQTSSFFNGEDIKNIHTMLPKGKQSDFVKGLAQMFNLQFETDPVSKTVYVEPYDHFYEGTSNAVNWTEKVDYSKAIKDEFLFDIKSKVIFKYKDASGDGLLDKYNKRNTVDWGSYEETDTSGKFQTGEYKVENSYFSPTFNWYEPNYIYNPHVERSPLVPMYFSDDTDLSATAAIERPEKEFDIGARILLKGGGYYSSFNGKRQWQYFDPDNLAGGNSSADFSWNKASFIAFDNIESSLEYDGTNSTAWHAPATNYLSQVVISNGYENVDYNLSFSDINHDTVISSGQQKLRGLFYNYYSKMVAQLKQNPRVKVLYLNLTKIDISKLDFRKLIFIDGSYYRLNKIIDFKPHDKQSTKVELQEYFLLGKSDIDTTVDIDVENLNM